MLLIVFLLVIYTIYTFPRSIYDITSDNIQTISIHYDDDIFDQDTKNDKEIVVKDPDTVKKIMGILNKNGFRKKILFKTHSVQKSTNKIGFILLTVSNEKDSVNPLQFYSDGTIFDGSNEYHIGLFGKSETKELYNELLSNIKTQ